MLHVVFYQFSDLLWGVFLLVFKKVNALISLPISSRVVVIDRRSPMLEFSNVVSLMHWAIMGTLRLLVLESL